ncbi:MAG: AI-2E family transporter [archaeon]|nr:AI-2E family transporter [archaeon]
MDEIYFRKVITIIIFISLIILSFLLIKPILLSIIAGLILAYIFSPIYNLLQKYIRNRDLVVFLICFFIFLLIAIPFWILTPRVIDEAFKVYAASQQIDLVTPLKQIFPNFFQSPEFSSQFIDIIHSSITKLTSYIMNSLAQLLYNLPILFLQFSVVLFTFYFALRDKKELTEYIKSLSPFPRDVEKKLFDYTTGITSSVIYGQIFIGIIQGLITGIGLFVAGVPNALFFTLIAVIGGMIPILGPFIVWIPVSLYMFINGDTTAALIVLIFGLIASTIDNILRPFIVSRRVKMGSSLLLIGMVGGLFLFGILGLIIGPLIIAYLLVFLELYRDKRFLGVFIKTD